jgi:hypothetical protein
MGQHTINMSTEVYERFTATLEALRQTSLWKPSGGRMVDFLLNLFYSCRELLAEENQKKSGEWFYFEIGRILNWKPPMHPRHHRRPHHYVSLDVRMALRQELELKLGHSATPEMLNAYIDDVHDRNQRRYAGADRKPQDYYKAHQATEEATDQLVKDETIPGRPLEEKKEGEDLTAGEQDAQSSKP